MDKKHPQTLVDAQTGGSGGTTKQGQAELSRRTGSKQQVIFVYMKNIDLEEQVQEAIEVDNLARANIDEL
jgi:hypothetical protein